MRFKSIRDVGKNPKGLFVTWITNWLIKPFTMIGIAWFFFYVVFKVPFHRILPRTIQGMLQLFHGARLSYGEVSYRGLHSN